MNKGFTLIELLVVVLIIGILAAVALPQYTKTVEKSRTSEAALITKAIFESQKRFFLENGSYATSADELDVGLPAKCPQTPTIVGATSNYACGLFQYILNSNSPNGVAIRLGGSYDGYRIAVTESDGAICYYYTNAANKDKLDSLCKTSGLVCKKNNGSSNTLEAC